MTLENLFHINIFFSFLDEEEGKENREIRTGLHDQ